MTFFFIHTFISLRQKHKQVCIVIYHPCIYFSLCIVHAIVTSLFIPPSKARRADFANHLMNPRVKCLLHLKVPLHPRDSRAYSYDRREIRMLLLCNLLATFYLLKTSGNMREWIVLRCSYADLFKICMSWA